MSAENIIDHALEGRPADVKASVEALVVQKAKDLIQARRAGEVIPKPANLADLGDSDLTKDD